MNKKHLKTLLAIFLVSVTVLGMGVTLFGAESPALNGWHTDPDGVERYYENGAYVTGNKKIGEYIYIFGSDGAYISMYDNPKPIGTVGVMDTDVYKSAVSALGEKVYLSMPIEPENDEVQYNASGAYTEIVAGQGNQNAAEKSNYIRNKNYVSGQYINVHLKNSEFEFVKKPNGKTAVKTTQAHTDTDPFINIYTKTYEAGTDYVFEAEYKLGENFKMAKSTISLMNLIDRDYSKRNNVTAGNEDGAVFLSLLDLNSNGMVYTGKFSGTRFICQLSEYEYTRISISVHPLKNSYDVYINGVLVVEGIRYVDSTADYKAELLIADEFRTFQYGGDDLGTSMCIDNIYVYGVDKPVCTEEAEPRNGIYVDENSAYIRYYENNLLVGGRVEVTGTYFGRTFDKEMLIFDKCGRYFVGNTANMVVNGQTSKSELVSENLFVAPSSPGVDEGRIFVGWKVTDAKGNSQFLRAGEKLRIDSDINYEPISLGFDMLDGASLRTDTSSAELRYIARISKSEYDTLKSLGMTIESHIITIPTEYIEKTYGYTTLEALKDLGSDYTEWTDHKSEAWYHTTDNYYYYTASVSNIATKDLMRDYSAVGYLKLVDGNGTETLLYADYSEENNARNVYEIAVSAYNDRTAKKYDGYSQKIKFDGKKTYSPYNAKRLNVVRSFIDNIIDIIADDMGVRPSGEYYKAPYELTVKDEFGDYSIKIKSSGSWSIDNAAAFVLNGEVLSDDGYTKGDGEYSLTVEMKKSDIYNDDDANEEKEKWYLVDIENSDDLDFFTAIGGNKIKLSDAAPNGETSAFRWNFGYHGSPKSITFFGGKKDSQFGWSMDEDGNSTAVRYKPKYDSKASAYVMDMSDWQTLTFYYYADEDAVGSKFMILANSENPAADGSDYYSYTVTVSNTGWNKVVVLKDDFSISRSPLGWNKITSFKFINSGWSLEASNGSYDQHLDFTSMIFDDSQDSFNVSDVENAAAFYPGGYACVVNSKFLPINSDNTNAVVFMDGDTYYLPVGAFASALADEATVYDTGSTVVMEMNGVTYRFSKGKKYVKDGKSVKLKAAAKVSEGSLFITLEDAMEIFGYTEKYIDRMGLIVLSNTKDIFDPEDDYDTIYSIIEKCTYVRPTGEKVYEDLMSYSGGVHPYIMLNQSDFDRLNYYKKRDDTLQTYIAKLAKQYDVGGSVYNKAPVEYSLTDGVRLLVISREAMARTRSFALLYKLYENDDPGKAVQLAERLWDELEAVCTFPDWHPAHYLDTAEMAYAVAIGYDWLYDYWAEYDKTNGTDRLGIMEEALYNYSLKTTAALGGSYNLGGSTNNWNGVCNGGTMTAALALVTNEKYRADAIEVITSSIKGVERGMWVYGPDGGYEEGPGYWGYGTTYLSVYMSALDSACGTSYGLYNAPGFAHSVYFTTYIGSLNTTWGFHDGGSGAGDTSIAAWFAKKSNDGNVNAIRRQAIENGWVGSCWYDIVWFSPHIVNDSITLELDAYYSLDTILTFRDSWDQKNTIFTGLHGGDNQASHGDLDIGNFIISVDGTHIICDLGADAYNIAGYFGNYRWSYYRKRAEGQNTLVMLPHGKSWDGKTGIPYSDPKTNTNGSDNKPTPDQNSAAVSECLRYETGKNSALGVIDMTPAYADYINKGDSAIRGLWFKDNRSTIIIQDEGKYNQAMDIWWFAHTKGNITVAEDGKSAVIEQNGICLYAELVTDIENATFYVSDAVSLDGEYVGDSTSSEYFKDDTELSRTGITKLCVKAENVTEYKLAVVFKVVAGVYNTPERGTTYTWTDIKDWKVD